MNERLTARDGDFSYYPECFQEPCCGTGCKKEKCDLDKRVCAKLADYEDENTLTPGEKVYIKHEDDYFGYILLMYNENYALLSPTIDQENNLDILCEKWAKHSITGHNCTLIVSRNILLTEAEVKEKEGVC